MMENPRVQGNPRDSILTENLTEPYWTLHRLGPTEPHCIGRVLFINDVSILKHQAMPKDDEMVSYIRNKTTLGIQQLLRSFDLNNVEVFETELC